MSDQATNLREKVEKRKKNSRIIAVASGKGGVGKTNISLNLGLALQELGKKVLLLDADLGMANVDILLGLASRYNLSHVLKGHCSFSEALLEGPGGLDILPGTSGEDDLVNISSIEVMRLLEASTQMEEFYDIILIDVGAGIHHSVTNFIRASDEVMIVLTPEPTSIMDAYSLIKILAAHEFDRNSKIGLLINQISSQKEGNQVLERMKKVIEEYLNISINVLGFIPYDSDVRRSVKEQTPFLLKYPKGQAGEAIREVAAGMLNRVVEKESRGMKGFVFRLVGIFNRTVRGEKANG